MSTTPEIAALNRARDHWNAGDLDGYLKLYRDDVVLHGYAGVDPGFAAVKSFYQAFWTAFAGSRLVFLDCWSSADKVTCRFEVHGTHNGNFQGMPATGRDFVLPGITILRFVGEHCVERWSQADFLGLLQQLGAIPGPG